MIMINVLTYLLMFMFNRSHERVERTFPEEKTEVKVSYGCFIPSHVLFLSNICSCHSL